VRQRNLARPGADAAAGQRCHAGGMMRAAEWPPRGQSTTLDLAGNGGDHRDLEQFRRRQRWQDRWQPRRKHRLARARRPHHQQVMAAGCCDFERSLGALLALDVAQVEFIHARLVHRRLRTRQHLCALEMVGDLDQRVGGDDLDVRACPGRLRTTGCRTDQSLLARIGADRGRQHAGDRRDRSVESELAEHREARQRVARHRANGRHEAERDWQIIVTAFLGQIGGGKVDRDSPRGKREAGSNQRGPHPLACLRHRLVG
jgi:hypothetical protein